MKAKVTLIATSLLILSSVAIAQEQKSPTAGAPEQEAPSEKKTGEEAPSMKDRDIGERSGGVARDAMQGMKGDGMRGEGMTGHGLMCHGNRRGHGSMMGPDPRQMRFMMILLDTDGDGALSLEEVQTAHARIFKAVDANKDGKVTLDEIQIFFRGGSPTNR